MKYSDSRVSSNTISRVGRYELGQTLGKGNFSTVKLARHIDTGDNVAIKIFDKHRVFANQPMDVLSKVLFLIYHFIHLHLIFLLSMNYTMHSYLIFHAVHLSADGAKLINDEND